MANTYIYDIDTGTFVSAQGLAVATVPAIHYGTKPVWNLSLRHADGTIPDLSSVVSFRAAVDTDFNASTDPLCRTITGIYYAATTGVLSIPLDAKTVNFRNRLNGRQTLPGYFEVHGIDANGIDVFYLLFRVSCNYVIDPNGSEAIDPDTGDAMTQEQIAAIAAQVCQEQQTPVDSSLDSASANPVANSAVTTALGGKMNIASGGSVGQVLTKTSGGYQWQNPQGGSGSVTVDSALNSSSTNPVANSALFTAFGGKMDVVSGGTAGQVLAKTASGYEWVDQTGGGSVTVDSAFDSASTNPVQNKVIVQAIGASNGIASLDPSGKVPSSELPLATIGNPAATPGTLGAVYLGGNMGFKMTTVNGTNILTLDPPDDTSIANRSSPYKAIVTTKINEAVTAALTDSKHITLNSTQQATARQVFGAMEIVSGGTAGQVLTKTSGGLAFQDVPGGTTVTTVRSTSSASISLSVSDQVVEWSPLSDATLSSVAVPASGTQYSWEVRLNLASAATLTLGNSISFAVDANNVADSVTGGAVNILLVRAIASGAKVFVCGTEAAQ